MRYIGAEICAGSSAAGGLCSGALVGYFLVNDPEREE